MVVSDPVLFATATSFERKAALADIDHKQLPAGLVPFLAETTKSNQKIFLGELGIGLINASINLALMINEICPKKIIFIGLGGALTEDIGIGDIVCAESVFQHDSFRSKSDGKKFFLKPGVSSLERDDHIDPKLYTDKNLNEKILNLLTDFTKNKIAKGVLASGSEFVCDLSRKQAIAQERYRPLAVDMESVGIVKVAQLFDIPCSIIRVISDTMISRDNSVFREFTENMDMSLQILGDLTKAMTENTHAYN